MGEAEEKLMSVPAEMTVVEIAAPGGPEQLKLAQRPVPHPKDEEVLVRVAAAGVNRPDVMQRQGRYPAPAGASDLPGLEVAGEIAALGPKVSGLSIGDKITALLPGGGYAQYAVAAAPLCLPVPSGISMAEAAAIPETFFTVWTNLFDRGRCKAGDTVLIHGGTSGIGTTAIQLASAGRRAGNQLSHGRFRRSDARGDGRQGSRRHARHGRRQLCRAQSGHRGAR